MTSLLDKSTPVPTVMGFHLHNFSTEQADACAGKIFKENHLHNAGTGGREVGNPKSGLIQERYISGVNRNHTVFIYRYFLKVKSSPNEHGLTIASGKLKIARHLSIQSFSQPKQWSSSSWNAQDTPNSATSIAHLISHNLFTESKSNYHSALLYSHGGVL
jgi:hypothetical protein